MKRFTLAAASLLSVAALAIQTADAQQRVGRGARANGAGGITAGQLHDRTGPNGGTLRGGRAIATDGQGAGIAGSANCATGAAGRACRAGVTARNAEGEVAHKSGIKIDGANGRELESVGGFTKDADGNIDQGRTTAAAGEQGSVVVDKSYTTETGRARTVTCANAAGEVVACPTR
jgi:hypothetical protein